MGCEPPSTLLFHCVSCPHNTPWCLLLQSEEASSSWEPSNGRHSSVMQCRKEQRVGLKRQYWHFNTINYRNITSQPSSWIIMFKNMPILTESSLNSQRCWLLRFITKAQLIDSLDTENVGFTCGKTTNHKPAETESHAWVSPVCLQPTSWERHTFVRSKHTWCPCEVCDWPRSSPWIPSHTGRCSSQSVD